VNQTQVSGTIAYNDILTSERLTRTYSELIDQRPVLQEVIDRLDLNVSREELSGMIDVGVVPDTAPRYPQRTPISPAGGIANTAASAL
jgi:capsular polysaccharide biosynthesis protein